MRKYALYAVGEILLVMVGILLALQVNNWNEEKKAGIVEVNLLEELKSNLETNIRNLENDIKTQEKGAWYLNYIIDHLEKKKPLNDSFPIYFSKGQFAPDVILASSAFETLKSTGLGLVQSNSLRQEIINLFEVTYPHLMQETKRLEDQLWPAVVIPLVQKYFKTLPNGDSYPTDYPALLNDREFLNMLSFRLHLRRNSTQFKKNVVAATQQTIRSIDDEINSRM